MKNQNLNKDWIILLAFLSQTLEKSSNWKIGEERSITTLGFSEFSSPLRVEMLIKGYVQDIKYEAPSNNLFTVNKVDEMYLHKSDSRLCPIIW